VPGVVEHSAVPFDKSAQAACDTAPEPLPLSAPLTVPAPPRAAATVPVVNSEAFAIQSGTTL
jgi:hypothetical protein